MSKVNNYLQDVQKEMKKVNWPERNELLQNSVLTLVASFILSLFIYASDQVISRVLEFVYRLG